MAKVPFQREIEDLFASDKTIVLKLIGGAFVGVFLSLRMVMKDARAGDTSFSPTVRTVVLIGGAIVGALVVLGLTLRDVVLRRVEAGQRVNPLLRAYFGKGNGCLMLVLWSVTVIFATFLVTMFTLNF